MFLIGLTEEDDAGALFGVEKTFHGGHRCGLVLGHVAAVHIARGKNLRTHAISSGGDPDAQEDSAIFGVGSPADRKRPRRT